MLLAAGNPVTLEEMRKVVKIQKISSHTHKTVSMYTCTSYGFFSNFLMNTPPPHASYKNSGAGKENLN